MKPKDKKKSLIYVSCPNHRDIVVQLWSRLLKCEMTVDEVKAMKTRLQAEAAITVSSEKVQGKRFPKDMGHRGKEEEDVDGTDEANESEELMGTDSPEHD